MFSREINGKISKYLILNKLKKNLPSYSLPKKIIFYKKFPLNINNKINKKKLRRYTAIRKN